MPPSRKPKSLEPLAVQHGDVVLALFGKHQWLPALVSETTDCSAPTVLIEFFGDHAVGQQPRTKLRPFSDIDSISRQPQSASYGRAVAEARRWLDHLSSPPLPPLPPLVPASEVFAHDELPKVMLKLRGATSSWRINGEPVPAALLKRATMPPPDLSALPTPSFRLASSGAVAGDESLDSVTDEAFAKRHAKFEKLERRGFAAHQRALAARKHAEPKPEQPSSSWRAPPPSPGAIEALSRRRAEVQASRVSRSPSKRVRGEISAQLIGQRLLVPTSIFGDERNENLVYEGRVVRRTRGRSDCVDVTFKVDGVTCSFAATQALLWLDLSELEADGGSCSGPGGGPGAGEATCTSGGFASDDEQGGEPEAKAGGGEEAGFGAEPLPPLFPELDFGVDDLPSGGAPAKSAKRRSEAASGPARGGKVPRRSLPIATGYASS